MKDERITIDELSKEHLIILKKMKFLISKARIYKIIRKIYFVYLFIIGIFVYFGIFHFIQDYLISAMMAPLFLFIYFLFKETAFKFLNNVAQTITNKSTDLIKNLDETEDLIENKICKG